MKSGVDPHSLTSSDFSITDKRYGKTLELHRCSFCGFLQTSITADRLMDLYKLLEDSAYVETEISRVEQQRELLLTIKPFLNGPHLLDVGAGSGILVNEANKLGLSAEGVEPSLWLVAEAKKKNIELIPGTLSDVNKMLTYDVLTFVDVLEHIAEPQLILKDAYRKLKSNGHLVVVVPDVHSIAARILGSKWWHFRIAHVGYFDRNNLKILLERSGFEIVYLTRPSWYFPLSYLIERVLTYFPLANRIRVSKFFDRFIIKLNLFDSWIAICRKI